MHSSLLPEAGISLQLDGLDFTSSFLVSPVDFSLCSFNEVKTKYLSYMPVGQLQDRILLSYRDSERKLAAFTYQFLLWLCIWWHHHLQSQVAHSLSGVYSVCVIGC